MTAIGVYETKTRLPRLLDQVAKGKRITITRHGVPIAMLVPAAGSQARPVADVIAELRAFRKGRRLCGLSLRAMIQRGRR
jgi:prevent-host-death family protein